MSSKHNLKAAFALLMLASACTVERQVFVDGQEIEWHKKGPTQIVDREALTQDDGVGSSVVDPDDLKASAATPHDSDIDQVPTTLLFAEEAQIQSVIAQSSRAYRGMSVPYAEGAEPIMSISDNQPANLLSEDETASEGNKGLVAGGWVVTSVGLLLLLFVSILLGLILIIGGVVMIAVGSPKKTSVKGAQKEKRTTGEWQDVVYLQNGSVIRGMVIEQVPNVSLKIQTADGSIFVYEMKDVLKITKEQKP